MTLQPGGLEPARPTSPGQAFTVTFTNQGDNDEFNIKVTLQIASAGGAPITLSKTVPKVAKGEKATVTLPLNKPPPLDTAVHDPRSTSRRSPARRRPTTTRLELPDALQPGVAGPARVGSSGDPRFVSQLSDAPAGIVALGAAAAVASSR